MGRGGIVQTLCGRCSHAKKIVSGKGSQFVLCQLSQADFLFAKYPPQPVFRCVGYKESEDESDESQ